MDVDPSCPWCGIEEETTSHVLFQCPVVAQFWFVALGLRVDGGGDFHELLSGFIQGMDSAVVERVFTAVYAVWEARNARVFEDQQLQILRVMERVATLQSLPRPASVQHPAVDGRSTWRRPAPGWLKINFDASVHRSVAGFGMVARDEDGEVLAAATLAPVMMQSAGLSEALCLRWAMQLAIDLGFRTVCFETNSLQLFQWWRRCSRGQSYLDLIISDCRSLLFSFTNMDVSFVRRSGNSAADFLARGASSFLVWIEEGPPGLDAFVRSDILASVPA